MSKAPVRRSPKRGSSLGTLLAQAGNGLGALFNAFVKEEVAAANRVADEAKKKSMEVETGLGELRKEVEEIRDRPLVTPEDVEAFLRGVQAGLK